jgi:hypothetical protein
VEFPQMPYVGFWHWPKAEVPYVCIEPWSSLPSRKDRVEDLEQQENLLSLIRKQSMKIPGRLQFIVRKKHKKSITTTNVFA